MQAELGWSTMELTGAYSLDLLCTSLAALPVGRWLDRHGPRALMTCGSLLAVLLVAAWSQVRSLAAFYLIIAGIGLVSAAVLYEPAFQIVAVWFRRQRARALTVLTSFGAFASFIFIPLSAWLEQQLGWRGALLALAAILGAITVPIHALLLRRRPEDLGLLPEGNTVAADPSSPAPPRKRSVTSHIALREPRFWLLTAAFAASTAVGITMTVHLIPFLIAGDHSPGFAATVAGLFGLMSLLGRMTIGPLAHRMAGRLITGRAERHAACGAARAATHQRERGGCLALCGAVRRRLGHAHNLARGAAGRAVRPGQLRHDQRCPEPGTHRRAHPRPSGRGPAHGRPRRLRATALGLMGLLALGAGAVLLASDPVRAGVEAATE